MPPLPRPPLPRPPLPRTPLQTVRPRAYPAFRLCLQCRKCRRSNCLTGGAAQAHGKSPVSARQRRPRPLCELGGNDRIEQKKFYARSMPRQTRMETAPNGCESCTKPRDSTPPELHKFAAADYKKVSLTLQPWPLKKSDLDRFTLVRWASLVITSNILMHLPNVNVVMNAH